MRTLLIGAALGALLSSPSSAQEAGSESLQAIGDRALRAVEEFLDVELERELVFRESTRSQVARVLREELLPQYSNQIEDEGAAKEAARRAGVTLSAGLLAKFEASTGNVLVVPKTITMLAAAIEEPALDSPETLQAILVHECVHVLAEQQYGFTKRVRELTNTDAILTYNAVVEGHAQFVAREVCKRQGWSEAFELFTSSIGAVPDLGDEALNVLARSQAAAMSWAYYDGESFIAAIHKAEGAAGVRRAYTQPPSDPSLIFNPDWYLDPSKRPTNEYDIEGTLRNYGQRFDQKQWLTVEQTVTPAQLEQVLKPIGEEATKRVLANVLACRASVSQTRNPPGDKLVTAALFICSSATEAAYVLASEEALMRQRDEEMKSGRVKIVDSSYTTQSRDGIHGLHAFKTVQLGIRKIPVTTVVLWKDRLVLELIISNEEISMEEAVARGSNLLEKALATAKEKEPGPKRKGAD